MIWIFSFLAGAYISRMYYRSKLRSAEAERDAWERKAKQAQADSYSDLIKNASDSMGLDI